MVPTGTASARIEVFHQQLRSMHSDINALLERIKDQIVSIKSSNICRNIHHSKPIIFINKEEYANSDSEDDEDDDFDESGYDSEDYIDNNCKVYPVDDNTVPTVVSECSSENLMIDNSPTSSEVETSNNLIRKKGFILSLSLLAYLSLMVQSEQLLSERIDYYNSPLVLFTNNLNNIAILLFRMQLIHLLLYKLLLYLNYKYL
jgi:hypothetical protein